MADAPEYRAPPTGLEPVPQYSTLEYNPNGHQDGQGYYGPSKMEGKEVYETDEPIKGEKQARLCGMKRKTAIILGAILLLLVIAGAVAGGVVGSQKKTSKASTSDQISNSASPVSSATESSTVTSTPSSSSTSSSATSTSSAPPIVVAKGEVFDSLKFHTISTYYGSDSAITRIMTDDAKKEREFYSIVGSFPSGGTIGSVGIVKFEPQYEDQIWHIMPAKSSQVPDPELYAKYGKQLSLMVITCQQYGQTIRLALDGTTPDATLTLAKQNDEAANQFWYTEQIEADIEGEYGRYALKNYDAGDSWHLGIKGEVSSSGKVDAPLVEGKPKSDVELWQIMPRAFLNETEKAEWGTIG